MSEYTDRIWNVACALLLIVGGVWFAWREREMARFKERTRVNAIHADSIQAARDTTRAVLLSVAGDSVRVYRRRILQVKQRSDSLDRAIGLERAARYRIEAAVTELRTQIAARVTEDADSVRSATFRVRDAPFYIDAAVTLPRAGGDARMTVRVEVDTAVFEARVGCGSAGAGGVRPATLSLAGPKWVRVRLTSLEQEARVCSPEVAPPRSSWRSRIRLGVGYGLVLTPDGRIVRGPGVSVSWSVWP